ncbi:hypothetical protein COB52_01170 [Candidatus Kaiserbacteria bacterium]|nr:MAG: hypothetical protein COB52_01170 [Candidatus Kaiserbacteria bacterium]
MKKNSYLPEFVYGSMDGLVTTFAIVTGSIGAALPVGIILVIGFANVLADAFSMGASSYLSAVSEGSQMRRPINKSFVTFASFAILGMVPLIPFVVAFFVPEFGEHAIKTSVIATLVAFGAIGYTSGSILGKNPIFTAIRNILIGGTAAYIAFFVGSALSKVFGV